MTDMGLQGTAGQSTRRADPGAPGLRMLAGLGLLVVVCCVLVSQVTVTLEVLGAAPPGESGIAEKLYNAHPAVVRIIAVTAMVVIAVVGVLVWRQLRGGRRLEAAFLAAVAPGMAVAAWPFLTGWAKGLTLTQMPPAGSDQANWALAGMTWACGAWVAVTSLRHLALCRGGGEWEAAEQRILQCVADVRPLKLLAFVPGFLLIAGVVSIFGSAAETVLHIMPAIRRYHLTGALAGYWAASPAIAMLFGMFHSVAIMNLVLIQFLAFRGLRRLGWLGRGGASLLLALGAAVYAYLFAYNGAMAVFEDEIAQLHFGGLVAAVLASLCLLYWAMVAWNLVELCRQKSCQESRQDGRPRDLSDLIRLFLLAAFLLPVGPLARLLRRRIVAGKAAVAAACAILLAAIAVLVRASFPTLEDHTSRAVVLWATGVTVAGIFLGYLLLPPRPRGWPKQLAALFVLLAGGTGVFLTAGSSAPVRLVFYEYAAISRAHWGTFEGLWAGRRIAWDSRLQPIAPLPGPKPAALPASVRQWRQTKPMILLIIWDAARGDHTSLYGYKRQHAPFLPTTPNLDAMRGELTWLSPAFSQATATTCSMRHIFTGRRSSRFMLKKEGIGPFFTNELIRAGYELHLNIVGTDYNGISEEAFFRDMPPDVSARAKVTTDVQQNELKKVRVLLDFLDRRGSERGLFAYIHMTATHFPWRLNQGGKDFGPGHLNLYDHNISYCDDATGRLIRGLKQRGMWGNTVLILTADHGTGLGEHGRYGGFHPYYEQISVPLVLHVPGMALGRVEAMVGAFDIAPTLVEPFFPDRLGGYDARSLWPVLLDPAARSRDRVLFGMSSFEDCYFLVTGSGLHYTWHRMNQYELLFNYRKDPAELDSLLGDRAALARCRGLMAEYLQQGKGRYTNPWHYKEAPIQDQ